MVDANDANLELTLTPADCSEKGELKKVVTIFMTELVT